MVSSAYTHARNPSSHPPFPPLLKISPSRTDHLFLFPFPFLPLPFPSRPRQRRTGGGLPFRAPTTKSKRVFHPAFFLIRTSWKIVPQSRKPSSSPTFEGEIGSRRGTDKRRRGVFSDGKKKQDAGKEREREKKAMQRKPKKNHKPARPIVISGNAPFSPPTQNRQPISAKSLKRRDPASSMGMC